MALTEHDGISIAEICVYSPALIIAIFLCIRHGFGRSSGWFYLIMFSLARLIGSAMQLATISQPTNISLYIGAAVLANVGLSPLILIQLGLLSRALTSIRKSVQTFVNEKMLRIVQLLILVSLILTTVGGSQAGSDYANTGVYAVPDLSRAGMGLLIAGFVLTVMAAGQVAMQISHAELGEKRLSLAVALALPFILVRMVYAAESAFSSNAKFNQLTGDINVQLGMSVIMEMIAVAIIEGFGLSLKKMTPKDQSGAATQKRLVNDQYEMVPHAENGHNSSR
ncbi:hypothetical protein BKA67DRAFT_654316 [Truncatella angustata]|uniref:DUF7702 domain-containing protein n=1 Tax=Truncatella angustata TaxID=152316 RepID=A0A9P8V0E4_9PEZI|nr:uncharacterized protein BKA67DRAFT_654316 [Truncatella angustata]KAH6661184.1 hypothetical protein BKA67DRAFT_654316 [Truncatella angustata]KAH8199858.1 hypothetical protein TruAng_005974 [Truncatella angustata]